MLHGGAMANRGQGAEWTRRQTRLKQRKFDERAGPVMREIRDQAIRLLYQGVSSAETVEYALRRMESSCHFNAGPCGSTLTTSGDVEMDAGIMTGNDLSYGAVIGTTTTTTTTAHPISLASEYMRGKKAPFYVFWQPEEREEAHDNRSSSSSREEEEEEEGEEKEADTDTVGCIVLDGAGRLCVGCSTGGVVGKPRHRAGGAAMMGAGIYADKDTCAVTCSGIGEEFIRHVAAFQVCALMKYRKLSVHQAADQVVHHILPPGSGGLIAMDYHANIAAPFSGPFFMVVSDSGHFSSSLPCSRICASPTTTTMTPQKTQFYSVQSEKLDFSRQSARARGKKKPERKHHFSHVLFPSLFLLVSFLLLVSVTT